ncbi:MAG: RNA pyrophosphohydrolase [Alphaproteobacteria bacterium]
MTQPQTQRIESDNGLPWRRGVGCVLFNRNGLIWIGERADMPGAWQMPQGGVDEGETYETAALRELEEEAGTSKARLLHITEVETTYEFPDHASGHPIKLKYRGQKHRWAAFLFEGQDSDIELETHHEIEFTQWKWATADEVMDKIVDFKRPIYEQALKELLPLLPGWLEG